MPSTLCAVDNGSPFDSSPGSRQLGCAIDTNSPCVDLSKTSKLSNDSANIVSAFQAAVLASPDTIAIDADSLQLTFRELDVLSSRLAWHIAAYSARGRVIPLLTTLSASAIVGILGILKAGAAYVPIDCFQWSEEHITSVLELIGGDILVYSDEFFPQTMNSLRYFVKIPTSQSGLRHLQTSLEFIGGSVPPLLDHVSGHDTACVIFTSGTTGKPKGVMLRHDAMMNFVASRKTYLHPTLGTRALLALTISFDACNSYLFTYLCYGMTTVLADLDSLQDRFATCPFVVLTPSILGTLIPPGREGAASFPLLRRMVLGGETAPQGLLASWHPPGSSWLIFNDYGPTEATCTVLTNLFLYNDYFQRYENLLLGDPIPGSTVHLRADDGREITSPGEEGEIIIGGICLAMGYWRDPERTAERFITWKSGRYYRSGDRGRWSYGEKEGKRILFQGRKDRIVKNRGFLVNLETEVDESVTASDLARAFNISSVFTIMVDGRMCMLLSPFGVDVRGLKTSMAKRLPAYQVPDKIAAVTRLPIGRTGKVDPKAVLAAFQRLEHPPHVEPTGFHAHSPEGFESEVLSFISEVLGLPRRALPHERFMDLGGNSLAAVAVSSRCKQLGTSIRPRDILLSKTIGDVLEVCRQTRRIENNPGIPEAVRSPESGAMTRTQRALLYASEATPGASIIQAFFTFPTDEIPRLRQAWEAVLATESIFRTEFDSVQNLQTVKKGATKFLWEEVVLGDGENLAAMSRCGPVPHDIGTSFRVFSSQEQSCLVWTIHHALIDGYSTALLLRKVGTALADSGEITQGPSFLQVVDDIERSQRSFSDAAAKFWAQQRAEIPSPAGKLELFPIPGPLPTSNWTRHMNSTIGASLSTSTEAILGLARRLDVTPVSLFYVAWAILLARYTGSMQVIFGAVLSGREVMVQNTETTVGPLICTAPLRVHLGDATSVADLAKQIFSKLHSLSLYQWLPDEQDSDSLHTVIASQQNLPEHPFKAELEDIYETTAVPITLLIQEDWSFLLNYRTDRFTGAQASQLAGSFKNAFHAIAQPEADVSGCLRGVMTESEELQLLQFGNAFSDESITDGTTNTVLDVFKKTVRDNGELRAVEKGDEAITYEELDVASTKLARRITQYTAPGDVVGVHATRSINWITSVFAIIKSGAVYCPLDESLPAEVRGDLFRRSGATLFLTPTRDEFSLAPPTARACLALEEAFQGPDGPDLPPHPRNPRSLAYICFTSGSTGKPKGVAVEHAGVVAMQRNLAARMHAGPGRRMMQFLAAGFDGSMLEIFSAICNGATLVLRPDNGDYLAALKKVDIAILTPSAVEGLNPADFPNLKYLYFGGEPLSQPVLDLWAPERQLFNYYGPTEVTMGAVLKKCEASSPVTIGKPHPSVRAYLLDEHQHLVPRGVVGEIVLAGVQVARCYLGMPHETAASFLHDRVSGRRHEKMYRTGDLGYWTEDGEIVCLGRKDRQVKVRGFRIGLGNVEEALCAVPGVRTAAAIVTRGSLLAWVTPSRVDTSLVAKEIESRLPVHARPQRIFAIDSFPLTANEKIDHRALVKDAHCRSSRDNLQHDPVELTRTEAQIAKVWQTLLGLDDTHQVLPTDNFISLGGHSMKQLALAARLSSIFGFRVPVQVVLKFEALGELAHAVDLLNTSRTRQTQRNLRELGPVELSPAEYEWWLKYQVAAPVAAACFNVVFACALSELVDCEKLAIAWSSVIARHKVLSSRFPTDCKGEPFRSISPVPPRARLVDEIDVETVAGESFNLETQDLVRVQISTSKMLVIISHVLCDLATLRILLNEVSEEYMSLVGLPSQSPPQRLPYTETTSWFDNPRHDDLEFWSRYLQGAPTPVPDPAPTDFSGTSQTVPFPLNIFRAMSEFSAHNLATIYQTILLGSVITLQALTRTSDIVLGMPFINRPNELEGNTVGLFLQPLPFRMDLSDTPMNLRVHGDVEVSSLVDRTKSSFQEMLGHAVQWKQLLGHLGLNFQKGGGPYPIFDTVVSLHDHRAIQPISLKINGAGPSEFPCTKGAKFKLLFEYTVTGKGDVSLRMEYRIPRLSHGTIARIYQGLLACFKALSEESSVVALRDAVVNAAGGSSVNL